ncbi:MAG: Na/Pi cotransporter family protein [Bdellovibrionales bacterium]|nr:Na/Pi cotransporter family protein [Bdellovibrionales bacterium]
MSLEEPFAILFFTLAGASAVIILGSKTLSDSLILLFPKTVGFFLSRVGDSRVMNSLGGTVISVLTQSSIASLYMAIGFGNSGLYSRKQVSAFMTGLGLAAVWPLWVIVFDWGWYELIFLAVGFYPAYLGTRERSVAIGRLFLGTGLIILGTRLLKMGLSSQPKMAFVFYNSFFSGTSDILTVLTILWMTVVIIFAMRSLLVPLAITLALFETDYISGLYATIFLISIFFSLSLIPVLNWNNLSTNVRKSIVFHLLSKTAFTVLAFFFVEKIYGFNRNVSSFIFLDHNLLNTQTSDILSSSHLVPFTFLTLNFSYIIWTNIFYIPFNKLTVYFLPSNKVKEFQKLTFIGEVHNVSPFLSIEQVRLEVRKMAAMVESMLHLTQEVLGTWQPNPEAVEKILKYEAVTDRLQIEMNSYLSKLMQLSLTYEQGKKVKSYLRMTKELENIADCCKALFYLQKNLVDSGRLPSREIIDKIKDYFSDLLSSYELLFTDLAVDEEDSVFTNQTVDENFRVKSMDLNTKYLRILKHAYNPEQKEVANHWVGEMMFKLDQIHRHTTNFYEAYRST